MDRSEVLTLVKVTYQQDAIGQHIPAESRRDIFCQVAGVSAEEVFAAGKEGLQPECRVNIFAPEYEGEEIAELDGRRYQIYRKYPGRGEALELYLASKAGV